MAAIIQRSRAANNNTVIRSKRAKKPRAERRFDTQILLSKFNTPELMKRRALAIAEANAGHTKKSDDALENILTEFEKLSF